ncbi:MAG: hypothetical protein WAM97_05985 [Acidimicrobiales bacterium]
MGTQHTFETPPAPEASGIEAADVEPLSPVLTSETPRVTSTRASRAWVRVIPALVLLAVILIFVFQNLGSTKVSFVTASGRVPLALALLAAAALGGLSVLAIGSVRILQLRKIIGRSHRTEQ